MPWISINQWKKKNKIGVPKKTQKLKEVKPKAPKERWQLIGLDTFSSEWYRLDSYPTQAQAEEAAQEKLREIERLQPTSSSGGQGGIQDQVHIERPDKTRYRVYPK